MTKIIKPSISNQNKETDKDTLRKEKEQELKQLLLNLTEEKTTSKFSDKNLDRQHEKIELLSGKVITIQEVKDIISAQKQAYQPKFPIEFYQQIDRLNKWVRPESEQYQHPPIVAIWTNEIIYGRYHKDVLPALQTLNPFVAIGLRANYHHQFLSQQGQEKLESFIDDAVKVMKKCTGWYEFRVKMFREFNVPFQIDAFEDPTSIK